MSAKNNYLKKIKSFILNTLIFLKVVLAKIWYIFFILLLIFIPILDFSSKSELYEHQFLAMDTLFTISLYEKDFSKDVLYNCEKKLKEITSWGNIFDPQSEISKINTQAQNKFVSVNPDLAYVIQIALEASFLTNGAFDITVKPVIDYYGVKSNSQKVKTSLSVLPKEVAKSVGYKNIVFNYDKKEIKLLNNAKLDLNGILKGYAVDEIVKILKTNNIKRGLVNGGGNIYALGKNYHNKPWVIGIKDPDNPKSIIKTLKLENKGIATSSGSERFFLVKNQKYSHMVNPKTDKFLPAQGSVTAVAEKAVWADAFSTAVYVDNTLTKNIQEAEFYIYK